MNRERRERLEEITEQLQELHSQLEEISEEEQNALDNMPESIQNSERDEYAQAKIDTIGDAMIDLKNSIDNLTEVLGD